MSESKKYLKNGDKLECNQGDAFPGLIVTNGAKVNVSKKAMANKTDIKALANIPVFGTCKILKGPCVHALLPWGGPKANVKVGGAKALLKSSSIKCTVGGTIKPK